MVIESHIAEILDTPEIVKSVEPGDTGDTQGGAQAAQGARGEEGQEGEAPWVRGHSQQVWSSAGVTFQVMEMKMCKLLNSLNYEI